MFMVLFMKYIFLVIFLVLTAVCPHPIVAQTVGDYHSPTEGVLDLRCLSEQELKAGIMDMLADFSRYMKKNFVNWRSVNKDGDSIGFFRCKEPMSSTEDGVRTNIDMGMTCAFLYKYGRRDGVKLPDGVSWEDIRKMAFMSLTFCLSTHTANKLAICVDQKYWGTSSTGALQFESSLWAMTATFAAYFLWDELSDSQQKCVKKMLDAECMYIAGKNRIPTRRENDTRAEENGWDVGVLAARVGLVDGGHSDRYFDRMRAMAINTFSVKYDKRDYTVIDPEYNNKTVAGFYEGDNIASDFTLQNHGHFHPGYQNVVIQELGEAKLALELFGADNGNARRYSTNAIFHNCRRVQDSVLNYLALPDGDFAMPNGNDWSMYLFDQITSFSTLACFLRDGDALMLESQAFKNIKIRQQTTSDGSWLLNSDIGQRRMGVQAHRVVMSYLMHEVASTSDLVPTLWQDFCKRYYHAKLFETQRVVRAASDYRLMVFSLCAGGNYSGYFVPNKPDLCKIMMPHFDYNNGGNFLGSYTYENKKTSGKLTQQPIFNLDGNTFVMHTLISYHEGSVHKNSVFYCTEGNAIIYQDKVKFMGETTLQEDNGGKQCVSFDKFTSEWRTISYKDGSKIIGADSLEAVFDSPWINIDNSIGIVSRDAGHVFRFGNTINNASIKCRLLTSSWRGLRNHKFGDRNDAHSYIYLSKVTAEETSSCNDKTILLNDYLPNEWGGIITDDNTGVYVLVTNFYALSDTATLRNFQCPDNDFVPILGDTMTIFGGKISATFSQKRNTSAAFRADVFVKGNEVKISRIAADTLLIIAMADTKIFLARSLPGTSKLTAKRRVKLARGQTLQFKL